MPKVKAVFFDAGGTLFQPYPSVGHIYASAAREFGIHCDPQILEQAFYEAWKRRGGLASLGSGASEAKERQWWYSLVHEVFKTQGEVPNFDELFSILHRSFEEKHLWEIFPDTIDVLSKLRKRGLITAIVSNWDLRLEKLLRNLELDIHINFWVSSSVCGATKPSKKIFQEALQRAGTRPEETVHVGDTYEEDVLGARAVGIRAYLIDRLRKYDWVEDGARIESLSEILDKV